MGTASWALRAWWQLWPGPNWFPLIAEVLTVRTPTVAPTLATVAAAVASGTVGALGPRHATSTVTGRPRGSVRDGWHFAPSRLAAWRRSAACSSYKPSAF